MEDDRLTEYLKKIDLRFHEPIYELHALAEYIATSKAQVASIASELPTHLRSRVEEAYRTSDEGEISIAWQEVIDIRENILPRFYQNSACLAIFSVFESAVISVAGSSQRFSKSKLSFNDVSGSGLVERARKYFEVVLDIGFCADNTTHERLQALTTVRNCLIHAGGVVKLTNLRQKRKLEGYLRDQNRGLSQTSHGDALIVGDRFLDTSYTAVDSCVRELIKDAKQSLDRRKTA